MSKRWEDRVHPDDLDAIKAWFDDHPSDDPCRDNERVALVGDAEAEDQYDRQFDGGCCGFVDEEIEVNGRRYRVGFNEGH